MMKSPISSFLRDIPVAKALMTIFEKKNYVVDVYCVLRSAVVVYVLNMYRFFFSCHYSVNNYLHSTYIVLGIVSTVKMI